MPLTTNDAQAILQGCLSKAEALGATIGISIVDARGDPKAALRQDGAAWRALFIAQGKAFASATHNMPSADLAPRADSAIMRALMLRENGGMIPVQGALPIRRNGSVIGAVGISGAPTSQLDEDIAAAGLAALDPQDGEA